MNMMNCAMEIGVIESPSILSRIENVELTRELASDFPIPEGLSPLSIQQRLSELHDRIRAIGKQKVLLPIPEIALLETFAQEKKDIEFIVTLPYDMKRTSKLRVVKNSPPGVRVCFIEEPDIPSGFIPQNGIIVTTGLRYADRNLVFPHVHRLMESYKNFLGRKAFAPVPFTPITSCPQNWISILSGGYFDEEI